MNRFERKLTAALAGTVLGAGMLMMPVQAAGTTAIYGNTTYQKITSNTFDAATDALVGTESYETDFQDPTGQEWLQLSYGTLLDSGEIDTGSYTVYSYTLGKDGLPDSRTMTIYQNGVLTGTADYTYETTPEGNIEATRIVFQKSGRKRNVPWTIKPVYDESGRLVLEEIGINKLNPKAASDKVRIGFYNDAIEAVTSKVMKVDGKLSVMAQRTFSYNDAGQLVQETMQNTTDTYILSYAYNEDGTVASKTSALDGSLYTRKDYYYDDLGFLRETAISNYSEDLSRFNRDTYTLYDYGANDASLCAFEVQ